jgi:hypothetical protein
MPPFLCKSYFPRLANGANGANFKIDTFRTIDCKKSSSYNLIQLKINSGLLVSDQTRINYMATKTQERSDALKEFYDAPDDALFDQKTIAAVRGCSEATMERDRWAGTGIPFIKINRAVRYRKLVARTWLEKCGTFNSTSEATVDKKPVVAVEPKKIGIYPRSGRLKAKGKVKTLDAVEKAAVKHVAGA